MHHGRGIVDTDVCSAAKSESKLVALQVVAEFQESTFEFAVIGVAGDPHFYRKLADTDEVFGRAERKVRGVLFLTELECGPKTVQMKLTIAVFGADAFVSVFIVCVFIDIVRVSAVHAHVGLKLPVQGASVIDLGHGI